MKSSYYLISLLLLASCAQKKEAPVEEVPLTPAQQLIVRFQNVVDSGKFVFGHSDDTAYGHTWEYEPGRSDVKEITGDFPGLINWDLGMIELDSAKNLDGVPFSYMANEIKNQHQRGGVNSISWHLRNPVSGADSWNMETPGTVTEVVTVGTEANKKMVEWLGKTADFISNLKDSTGNVIPVVFRPWHEHSGNWFWWGATACTPEEYKELWKITRKVFDEKGVDNVVWAYSPDIIKTEEEYMERYPGDEYVDIMGIDIYAHNGEEGVEKYRETVDTALGIAAKAAKDHKKILAFTETGLESVTVDDWFPRVLLPAVKKYPVAFVCVWRNAHEEDKPDHYYAPYPGHPSAQPFLEFYNSSETLFANDLKKDF